MQPLNPNTSPLGTLRSHANAQAGRAQATNRLATGLRINRAADDPAGLISSEQLRAVLAALEAETRASHRTDAVANTADAALAEAASMVSDAKALAVAAANTGALSDAEREALQIEMDSMTQAASRTLERAGFAGERLFDGKTTLR
ncbi:MAG: flagellin, partial [Planctomycetota bacterium]